MFRCSEIRESLSARIDGEVAVVGDRDVRAHLGDCAACTSFAAQVDGVTRRVRVGTAEQVPDLTAAVLRRVAEDREAGDGHRLPGLRLIVALAGTAQAILGLAVLLGVGGHLARDLGAFELALGVGLLVVAWEPRRAHGLLPMALVVVAVAGVSSTLDVAMGRTGLLTELPHLAELVGVAALWALTRHVGVEPPVGRRVAGVGAGA